MPDSTPQEPQKTPRRFRVSLIQTVPEHEVVSENFEYDVDNKQEALKKAQNFVDDEKEMGDTKYRLEAEEIEVPEVQPLTPSSTESTK